MSVLALRIVRRLITILSLYHRAISAVFPVLTRLKMMNFSGNAFIRENLEFLFCWCESVKFALKIIILLHIISTLLVNQCRNKMLSNKFASQILTHRTPRIVHN